MDIPYLLSKIFNSAKNNWNIPILDYTRYSRQRKLVKNILDTMETENAITSKDHSRHHPTYSSPLGAHHYRITITNQHCIAISTDDHPDRIVISNGTLTAERHYTPQQHQKQVTFCKSIPEFLKVLKQYLLYDYKNNPVQEDQVNIEKVKEIIQSYKGLLLNNQNELPITNEEKHQLGLH